MATAASIIFTLRETGHLEFPFGEPNPHPIDPLPTSLSDPAVKLAVESYQAMHADAIVPLIAKHYPNRSQPVVRIDGEVGPAMQELFEQPRCRCPDYTAETFSDTAQARGSGGWGGCHGIGNFHAVSIRVTNNPPAHIAPHWEEIKRRVNVASNKAGFHIHWDGRNPTDISLEFVTSSNGWIGLATVGNRSESCGSPGPQHRWLKLLATYGNNWTSVERLIHAWVLLILHEVGHIQSMGHANRSIMSSYLDESRPEDWLGVGDAQEQNVRGMFGGQPIPSDEPEPPVPPPNGEPPYRIPGVNLEFMGVRYVAVREASV